MQRRKLLLLASLVPVGFLFSRHLRALKSDHQQPVDRREQALKLNQLATSVHTRVDAHRLVEFVGDIFEKDLPPALRSRNMRERVASVEFATVSDPRNLIPEQRLAQAWNGYVKTIDAPPENLVSAAEVHNLRDASFSIASYSWREGDRNNIWTVPGIYAVHGDGSVAHGCRALESLRILWDLANMPDNAQAARVRARQGILASDQFRQLNSISATKQGGSVGVTIGKPNAVEDAGRSFVKKNGIAALGNAVLAMIDLTLT